MSLQFLHRFIAPASGMVAALVPNFALAFDAGVMVEGLSYVCNAIGIGCGGGGAEAASGYVMRTVVAAARTGFVAIAIVVLMVATFNMLVESGDEGKVKEGRMAFLYALIGGIVVSLSSLFVDAFSPNEANGILVNCSSVVFAISTPINALLALLGTGVVLNIVVQGFRLIASRGEQDQIDPAKKRLIATFIGAIIVLIAKNLVNAVISPSCSTIAPGSSLALGDEIVGLANYLLTFFGVIAVILFVVAGMMYIFSADEGLKDRGKTFMKVAVIALVAVLVSYPLIAAFSTVGSQ